MFQKKVQIFKNHEQFQNLTIYGFGQAFNLLTPLLVIPYIVLICGVDGYGKISVGMALSFFLIVFIDYGSDIVGVKEVSVNRYNHDLLEKIFVTMYAVKFTMLVLVSFVISVIFFSLPYFSHEKPLFFLSLSIIIGQFVNPTWFLQGTENFKWITTLNVLSKIIYVIGIFAFIHKPSDYIYNNLFWGIGMIFANLIGFLYIIKTHSFSFQRLRFSEVKLHLINGFSLFSSQVFVSIQLYAPLILIGFFGGGIMAGTYRIVDQIVVIFKTYILLFFNFVFPRLCYLIESDQTKAKRFWWLSNGTNFIFILSGSIVIWFFSEPIVAYFNAKEILAISHLLQVAVLIPLMMAVSVPLKQLILGLNMQKLYVRATMILVIFNTILVVIAIPTFGILGVLISLLIVESITALLFSIKVKNSSFFR